MIESFKQIHDLWSAFEQAQADMRTATARIKACRGKLTDLSLLPQLYEWYLELARQQRFNSDIRNSNHKQFVFVALMLYAPMALCGGKIENQLRREIASILHLRSNTMIYHLRDKAVAWNKTYKTFASEVETTHDQILLWIREQGWET